DGGAAGSNGWSRTIAATAGGMVAGCGVFVFWDVFLFQDADVRQKSDIRDQKSETPLQRIDLDVTYVFGGNSAYASWGGSVSSGFCGACRGRLRRRELRNACGESCGGAFLRRVHRFWD